MVMKTIRSTATASFSPASEFPTSETVSLCSSTALPELWQDRSSTITETTIIQTAGFFLIKTMIAITSKNNLN